MAFCHFTLMHGLHCRPALSAPLPSAPPGALTAALLGAGRRTLYSAAHYTYIAAHYTPYVHCRALHAAQRRALPRTLPALSRIPHPALLSYVLSLTLGLHPSQTSCHI